MAGLVSSAFSSSALRIICLLLALDVAVRLVNFNHSELNISSVRSSVSSCPPERQHGNEPQDAEKQHGNDSFATEKQHGNAPDNTDDITGAMKTLLTDSAYFEKSDDDAPKLSYRMPLSKLRRESKFDSSFKYTFDTELAQYLSMIVRSKTVLELGAGRGHYSEAFSRTAERIHAVDGADDITELTSGFVKHADLTQRLDLGVHDWVVCLEVGERVPRKFELSLVDNIHRHNKEGVILAWGDQRKGAGRVNPHTNKYIKSLMLALGYNVDLEIQGKAREAATMLRFKKTIMIFRRTA